MCRIARFFRTNLGATMRAAIVKSINLTVFVAGDEAYKSVHDALMSFNGDITQTSLSRLASSFDLDTDAIQKEMDSAEVTAAIANTRELAQAMQISGTPTFVMQDELLRGYLPYDQMKAIVAEKRD